MSATFDVVVLISGSGTNLQALIDSSHKDKHFRIVAVIANEPGAYGLQRAAKASIANHCIPHRDFENRAQYEQALIAKIDSLNPSLIALAGYMRVLSAEFVGHYRGKMLNIHPSLLPKFRGLNTHQRALDEGEQLHGCSVHLVTEDLDCGPVILQASVPVLHDDSAATLADRVLQQEHIIYPKVINWYAQKLLHSNGNQLIYKGRPLNQAMQLNDL